MVSRKSTDLDEGEKIWHKQQETILKKWSEIGSSYRFMHDRSYTKYNTLQVRLILHREHFLFLGNHMYL